MRDRAIAPRRWTVLAAGLVAGLVITAATAVLADPLRGAAMCEAAVAHGARKVGVPVEVLHAIALTETGRRMGGRVQPWPWAVNREGQGFWFKNRTEVLDFARASLAEGRRSFDLGCFQINYNWHGHNFPSVEAMVDPETSAVYAAQFLRDLHAELGTWPAAAGAYHSRTPQFANRYRARFEQILAGLRGSPLTLAGDFVPATAPEPEAPTLQGGMPPRLPGPKIITISPQGSARAPDQDAKRSGPGVVVTLDAAVAPLPAGRRL
jgi:Transglycosylase SLT domain